MVLAAYLVGARNEHHGQGSFAGVASAQGLYREINTFLGMSPSVCSREDVEVHVVHDVPSAMNVSEYRGVQLHGFEPDASYLGGDRRWGLYQRLLQAATNKTMWSCVWALDLDVAAISVPPCGSLEHSALYLGSDGCSPKVMSWLNKASTHTLLNRTWGQRYRSFLANRSHPIYNSGIIGGRRSVWTAALKAVVDRLEAHRASSHESVRHVVGADMLLWNWAAISWRHSRGHGGRPISIVTGYPRGPVNFPMWAKLPSALGTMCPPHLAPDGVRPCNSQCGYEWLNHTAPGAYWFGHKLPRSWLNLVRLRACFPEAAARARGADVLRRVGGGKLLCECPSVGATRMSVGAPNLLSSV